jgi:hypothetical protein
LGLNFVFLGFGFGLGWKTQNPKIVGCQRLDEEKFKKNFSSSRINRNPFNFADKDRINLKVELQNCLLDFYFLFDVNN